MLDRSTKVIQDRVGRLKRWGGMKVQRQQLALTEDLVILESLVLPKLVKAVKDRPPQQQPGCHGGGQARPK